MEISLHIHVTGKIKSDNNCEECVAMGLLTTHPLQVGVYK